MNGIFLILSCKKYSKRQQAVTNTWKNKLNKLFKSFFIVGDLTIENEYQFDYINDIIYVKCRDEYDFLPHKVKLGIKAISTLNPDWIIKIDDDMVLDCEKFQNWLTHHYNKDDYIGRLQNGSEGWENYAPERYVLEKNKNPYFRKRALYCAGPCYYLSKKAYQCLIDNMDPEYCKLEDVNVGTTLYYNNIIAKESNIYTDHYNILLSSNSYFCYQDTPGIVINDSNSYNNSKNVYLSNSGGGLGNQIFQVCTLFGYAKEYNNNPILLSNYGETYRHNIIVYKNNIFKSFQFDIINNSDRPTLWKEPNFYFDNIPEGFNFIKGYFQSFKYFDKYIISLRNMFYDNLTEIREEMIKKWFTSLSNDTIMIHIRLGDYVTKYNDIYYTVDENYVKEALNKIKNVEHMNLCVFSDDFPIVKNWSIWNNYNTHFIEEENALHTFVCMLECKHHIISNSSLSLSATLLSKNQYYKIAPKKWFKNNIITKLEDLYPSNYILI